MKTPFRFNRFSGSSQRLLERLGARADERDRRRAAGHFARTGWEMQADACKKSYRAVTAREAKS